MTPILTDDQLRDIMALEDYLIDPKALIKRGFDEVAIADAMIQDRFPPAFAAVIRHRWSKDVIALAYRRLVIREAREARERLESLLTQILAQLQPVSARTTKSPESTKPLHPTPAKTHAPDTSGR